MKLKSTLSGFKKKSCTGNAGSLFEAYSYGQLQNNNTKGLHCNSFLQCIRPGFDDKQPKHNIEIKKETSAWFLIKEEFQSLIYCEDTGHFPAGYQPELLQDMKRLHFHKPLTQHISTPTKVDLLY